MKLLPLSVSLTVFLSLFHLLSPSSSPSLSHSLFPSPSSSHSPSLSPSPSPSPSLYLSIFLSLPLLLFLSLHFKNTNHLFMHTNRHTHLYYTSMLMHCIHNFCTTSTNNISHSSHYTIDMNNFSTQIQ